MSPDDEQLVGLHEEIEAALESGDESRLSVLGYGEVSCVLALDGRDGSRFAVKRLPGFGHRAAFADYSAVFERYLGALSARGITTLASELRSVERPDGSVIGYCVQRRLEAESLLPSWLRQAGEANALEVFEQLSRLIAGAVNARLGLDGQISNWAYRQGHFQYLDLTTPLLRDDSGREALDVRLFVASLPWALRGPVKRLVLPSIIGKYYEPRGVLLDLLGNLQKEGLDSLVSPFIQVVNRHINPPVSAQEVAAYYRDDARTWSLLLGLRRVDRVWQLKVRRRPYPFLLPRHVERRL